MKGIVEYHYSCVEDGGGLQRHIQRFLLPQLDGQRTRLSLLASCSAIAYYWPMNLNIINQCVRIMIIRTIWNTSRSDLSDKCFTSVIIYIKILLDCDWLISVQLITNRSAKICNKLIWLVGKHCDDKINQSV
jgi:hypothetical protein